MTENNYEIGEQEEAYLRAIAQTILMVAMKNLDDIFVPGDYAHTACAKMLRELREKFQRPDPEKEKEFLASLLKSYRQKK